MYSQGLIGADGRTAEDQDFLNRFQARIDDEQKIEPNDPMPEGYRIIPVSYTHLTLPTTHEV